MRGDTWLSRMARIRSPLSPLRARVSSVGTFPGKECLRVSQKSRDTLARITEEMEAFREVRTTNSDIVRVP